MDEPRTHYQLSFTSRQALLLFVGLLVALGVAYTLGVLTGLAGRDREPAPGPGETRAAAAAPTPEPTAAPHPTPASDLELPKPVRGVSPRGGTGAPAVTAVARTPGSVTRIAEAPGPAAPGPTAAAAATPGLQMFEDEGGPPPPAHATRSAAAPSKRPTPAPAAGANAFWVQAISASSANEARTRRDRLAAHGYPAVVVPGEGASGAHVYRVRVGPYKSREDADRAAAKLKANEKLQPWVVPPGK